MAHLLFLRIDIVKFKNLIIMKVNKCLFLSIFPLYTCRFSAQTNMSPKEVAMKIADHYIKILLLITLKTSKQVKNTIR